MGMIPPEACRMAKLRIFIDHMPSHGRYFIPPRHICPILTWHSLRCPVNLPYPDNHVITVRAKDFYLVVHSLEETRLLINPPCFQSSASPSPSLHVGLTLAFLLHTSAILSDEYLADELMMEYHGQV